MARVEIGEEVRKTAGSSPVLQVGSGVSVQVNVRGGSAATVYQAATGGSTYANPLTTDSQGRIEGWLEEGSYDLVISPGSLNGVPEYTQRFEAVAGASMVSVESVSAGDAYFLVAAPTGVAATDTAAIQAQITAAGAAGGGIVLLRKGQYTITSLSLAGIDNVKVQGAGRAATHLIFNTTTGNVVDMTDSSFCEFSDMHIRPTTEKTAGAVFYLDEGSGGSCQRNGFYRLRMSSSYRAWHLDDCDGTTIDTVQFLDLNTSFAWHSFIHLAAGSVSTIINNIENGTAATVANAFVYISGSTVDTVQGSNWNLLNTGGTGAKSLYITAGQWIHLDKLSLESGTSADCVDIAGGRGIFLDGHFLGQRGVVIDNATVVRVRGHVLECQQNGVVVGGGSSQVTIDADMTGLSKAATNTHAGVRIVAGATRVKVRGKIGGNVSGGSTVPKYCVEIESGASDHIDIDIDSVGYGTSPVNNAGTGTNIDIDDGTAPRVPTPIGVAVGISQALTTSLADVTNSDIEIKKSSFGPGNYQIRARVTISGATAADSLECQLFSIPFSNVTSAVIATAAVSTDPQTIVSTWVNAPATANSVRVRVRNATGARGNCRGAWLEVRRV